MKTKKIFPALLMALLLISPAWLKGESKFSGLMIGDYYYAVTHHDSAVKDNNGFWFRRIYFTYDNTLTDKIAMRFRLEANSPGDFKTSSTLVPYIKDAYLSARIARHTLMLGLIGTNMYDNVEGFWGYRPMEKTPIDLFRFGNSRELGLGVNGALDSKGKLTYALVFGNGAGTKSETDRGKAVHGRINFQPVAALFLEIFADHSNLGNDSSINIFQAFAGIKGGWGRGGFNFGVRSARQAETRSDTKFVSVFGVFKLSEKVDLIGRFDRLLDPNSSGSRIEYIPMADNVKANVLLAGIGWSWNKNVQIVPHLKYIFYDAPASGDRPAADFYTYLTLYFKF